MDPAEVFTILRGAMLAAGAICFGTTATFLLLKPAQNVPALEMRLRAVLRVAAVILGTSAILALPVQTANVGESWQDALSPATVELFATATQVGRAALVRMVLALLTAAILISGRASHRTLGWASLMAGLFLASFAASGHAAMHESVTGTLHQFNHVLHVLSGSFWVGALVALLTAAYILRRRPLQQEADAAELMLWRFSPAGVIAVCIVGLTGAINTWLILGKVPTDLTASYNCVLLAKIAAVLTMLVCALLNRFYFLPRVSRTSGANGLAASITIETALGGIVIALVALLGTLEPMAM
ncbi:MAG: copper homeostasis membrane protein CopD [Hyphomicrobiaceae bacterium]